MNIGEDKINIWTTTFRKYKNYTRKKSEDKNQGVEKKKKKSY